MNNQPWFFVGFLVWFLEGGVFVCCEFFWFVFFFWLLPLLSCHRDDLDYYDRCKKAVSP